MSFSSATWNINSLSTRSSTGEMLSCTNHKPGDGRVLVVGYIASSGCEMNLSPFSSSEAPSSVSKRLIHTPRASYFLTTIALTPKFHHQPSSLSYQPRKLQKGIQRQVLSSRNPSPQHKTIHLPRLHSRLLVLIFPSSFP